MDGNSHDKIILYFGELRSMFVFIPIADFLVNKDSEFLCRRFI